jgi:hypothetical protein
LTNCRVDNLRFRHYDTVARIKLDFFKAFGEQIFLYFIYTIVPMSLSMSRQIALIVGLLFSFSFVHFVYVVDTSNGRDWISPKSCQMCC